MREFAKIVVITVFILIVGTFIAVFLSYILKEQQVKSDAKKLQELYPNILEGANTGPVNIKIDYSNRPISIGSPLIFGGNHGPQPDQIDAWDKIAEIGITSMRKDFFPENALPKNITLSDYKNNKNDVQNPVTWDWNEINKINDMYILAQERGMKTIGIVAYAPAWLTHSNTIYGVPQDWEVFEDITKKMYRIYRKNIDYIEIWNEADWQFFLNLKNSGMSAPEAYENIFYHAAKSIREVDNEINDGKRPPIGGPVASDTVHVEMLEAILESERSKEYLDFVSYHNYELKEGKLFQEPSWNNYKNVLEQNNSDLPFFLTEWNYTAQHEKPVEYNNGSTAILYTANKFIDFLKMGLTAANYHVIEPLDLNKENEGEGYFGFYKLKNGRAELVHQAKTWRILSKQMSLGYGRSQIYAINKLNSDNINSIGFKNSVGDHGIVIINSSQSSQITSLLFSNIPIESYARVQIYNASTVNDAKSPVFDGLVKIKDGVTSFTYSMPKETVVGIRITEEKNWYQQLF